MPTYGTQVPRAVPAALVKDLQGIWQAAVDARPARGTMCCLQAVYYSLFPGLLIPVIDSKGSGKNRHYAVRESLRLDKA